MPTLLAPPHRTAASSGSRTGLHRQIAGSYGDPTRNRQPRGRAPNPEQRRSKQDDTWHLADENRLIDAAISGRRDAFSELVQRYQSRLYANTLKLARSHESAEDIVQETWVKAFCNLHTFRRESALYSWLFRIAFNQFLALRRRKNIPAEYCDENSYSSPAEPLDGSPSAEELLEKSEDQERVQVALQQLDVQFREIIELREFHGYTYQELSEKLNLKIGTVRSRLSRAKSKLEPLLLGDIRRRNPLTSGGGRAKPR